MTETLYFPEIIAPAAPVAVIEPKSTDLSKIDLTAVALAQYGDWRKDVAATKANLSTLVLDLSTPTKIKEARTLRARLIGDPLAAVRKVATGIKSKMAQTSKALGAELEKIEAGYAEADALILPQIEAREAELESEREEARKIEEARKAVHDGNIARIRAYSVLAEAHVMPAERIAKGIAQLEALPTPTTEQWEEFAFQAANAISETLHKMRTLHARAVESERLAAENARLQAELAAARAAAPAVTTEHTPQGDNRDASAEQSHVAEGSASPTGQGADGPTACGAAPVSSSAGYTEGRASQQVLKAEPATADATDRDAPVDASPRVGAMGAGQAADAAPAVADEKPTLKLGDINDWLGGPVTTSGAGLALLGIEHSGTEKAAKLYKHSDKARIKAALIAHLEGLN